jgi:flagellar L-ring protein precursor FlgH
MSAMMKKYLAFVVLAAILSGCASVPNSIVQQPTSAKAQPVAATAARNGAIFQSAAYRPLFEDTRARMVGDILTMNITERTTATKAASDSDSKTGSIALATPKLFGAPLSTVTDLAVNSSSANKSDNKAAVSSANTFSGTMAVTVTEVLPNGNLVVSGEKQVAFDKNAEFIRFSGVVKTDTIIGNTVSSTQVADARIEYRTNTRVDTTEVLSHLARFVFSLSPF